MITTRLYVMSQKSTDPINIAAEACNHGYPQALYVGVHRGGKQCQYSEGLSLLGAAAKQLQM